jgi:hypothetical protein
MSRTQGCVDGVWLMPPVAVVWHVLPQLLAAGNAVHAAQAAWRDMQASQALSST